MISNSALETSAWYGPALLTAPLAAIDPSYGAITFGMVAGWCAIAGVMVEQRRRASDIRRAMFVSMLIGGGGGLSSAFAVERLTLSPIEAALVAFTVAFGGVKAIKFVTNSIWRVVDWFLDKLLSDAERFGCERQKAHLMTIGVDIENRRHLELSPEEESQKDSKDDQNSHS